MLKTFRIGGIHPPENKLTADRPIEQSPLPKQAVILLSQHIGTPAQPVVAKGDRVKVGTLIAKASGFVSANIHSSVSGIVAKIENATDISGYSRPAIFIDVEGDEWEENIIRNNSVYSDFDFTSQEIIEKISEAGIVGLGGATFPTQVKLSIPPGKKTELLIINGVECEPYLTSDHRLMLEKSKEIIVGIRLLMKAIGVNKAIVGIENNKPDAIRILQSEASENPDIEICPLKIKYPQGGEKQLIDAIMRRQVASGALPISTGAVVQNIGTAFAVYEAVQKNKPLIERIVTITGKSVKDGKNLLVRIGSPIKSLIETAGGIPENTGKIIAGGPMMGKAVADINASTTKGCSGILLIHEQEASRKKMRNCIRCAKCVHACPMGLTPSLLMRVSELSLWEKAENEKIMDCIECGSCSYSCPANRPLLDYIRAGKSKVGTIIRKRTTRK